MRKKSGSKPSQPLRRLTSYELALKESYRALRRYWAQSERDSRLDGFYSVVGRYIVQRERIPDGELQEVTKQSGTVFNELLQRENISEVEGAVLKGAASAK